MIATISLRTNQSAKRFDQAANANAGRPGGRTQTSFTVGATASKRILIVGDNDDLARGLSHLLRLRGYDVRCAHTGVAALKLAQAFQPEVALVDVALPDLNGYEVAAMLPGVVSSKWLRIASFSGYSGEEEYRLSKAAGCVSHLQKPVEVEEIQGLLAGHRGVMDLMPK